MKKNRSAYRDVKFFVIGIFTFFIIQTALDWKEVKRNIIEGYNAGFSDSRK